MHAAKIIHILSRNSKILKIMYDRVCLILIYKNFKTVIIKVQFIY